VAEPGDVDVPHGSGSLRVDAQDPATARTGFASRVASQVAVSHTTSAAAFVTATPVSREPVNVITGTSGWRTSRSPASSP